MCLWSSWAHYRSCTSSFGCVSDFLPTRVRSCCLAHPAGSIEMHLHCDYTIKDILYLLSVVSRFSLCVQNTGLEKEETLRSRAERGSPRTSSMKEEEMEKVFLSPVPSPDHTGLTSAPSRPGDPSCPLSPYQKRTISLVCGHGQRPWYVKRG